MLDYETCRKLKECGFEFRTISEGVTFHEDEGLIQPTLSELIDACGEEMTIGIRKKSSCAFLAGDPLVMCDGKTPEEAVAALYLALNEKKDD